MSAAVKFSPLQQRKIAAIVGGIVGDAAAQPLHWVYKEDVLSALTEDVEEIEFRHPSANPFYRIPTGSNTCYGDEAFSMLKSLVVSKGLSIDNLKEETYKMFGPDSVYESKENAKYIVGKEDKINVKKTLPIEGAWRNGSIKHFLANLEAKKEPTGSTADDQIDCAIRIIPLVALYAGHPDLLTKVEEGLAVTQVSDMSIASALAAARVFEQYILHQDPKNVLQTVIDALANPENPNPKELDKAIIGQIRQVIKALPNGHANVVKTYFKNN